MVDTPTPAQPVAMTWAKSGDAIVKFAATYVLAHCILTNRRWNTLTDSDVSGGMDLIAATAKHYGIMAGTAVATPADLLAEIKAVATELEVPVSVLPQPTPAEPPAPAAPAPTPSPILSGGTVSSPGTTAI